MHFKEFSMKTILALLFLVPSLGFALEVDEKLTVRIVKTSESKKTVMLNRGTEDGLVEGDHAKLIVTAGIVARAVCVKVSPTRSIWSIYRLVNADFILNDSVMSIKITPAVKITKDETQALVQEDTPSTATGGAADLGIPLAEGADDLSTANESLNNSELKSLEESNVPTSIVDKNIEVIGFLNISSLSANSKTDISNESFSNSQSYQHIGLGGEYYPLKEREWYGSFSLIGSVALIKQDSQAYNGAAVTNDLTEFSVGANWHPTKHSSVANDFIPYLTASFNLGTVKSTYKMGTNSGDPDLSADGKSSGFSIGGGYKFYTFKGFGARFLLDYYTRTEKFQEDIKTNIHNKSVSGPRLMFAVSYRF
jgi:hypothetical protein